MAAPKGNQFWKLVSNPGRPKTIQSPDIMWEKACEYFSWCDDNPWYKKELMKSGDLAGEIIDIPVARPYTLSALCAYLGITEDTFRNYSRKDEYKEFFEVTRNINQVMYSQKFEGAAVGTFNSNIIARDLGLADKSQTDVTSGGEKVTNVMIIGGKEFEY